MLFMTVCESDSLSVWPRHKQMFQMKTFQPYFLVYSIYSDYILAVWWSPMPFNQFKCTCLLEKKSSYLPRGCPQRHHVVVVVAEKKRWEQHKYLILRWENIMCKCSISWLPGCQMTECERARANQGAEVPEWSAWSTHESHDVAFSVFVVVVVLLLLEMMMYNRARFLYLFWKLKNAKLLSMACESATLARSRTEHARQQSKQEKKSALNESSERTRSGYTVFSYLRLHQADDDTFCMCNIKV